MPYEIVNTLRSKSLIRVVGNTATTITLANLEKNASEKVVSAEIAQVCSTTDGVWRIYRGDSADPAKLLLELPLYTQYAFYEFDISLANNATSNIYVTNSGTCGTLIMQVSKDAVYNPSLDGM